MTSWEALRREQDDAVAETARGIAQSTFDRSKLAPRAAFARVTLDLTTNAAGTRWSDYGPASLVYPCAWLTLLAVATR